MSEQVTIYALCDDSGVRYVGKTRRPEQRRRWHEARHPGWTMVILETVSAEHADATERRLIGEHLARGCALANRNYTPAFVESQRAVARAVWDRRKAGLGPAGSVVGMRLKIPADLYDQVSQWAKEEERSLHAQIIWCLRQCMAQRQKGRRP